MVLEEAKALLEMRPFLLEGIVLDTIGFCAVVFWTTGVDSFDFFGSGASFWLVEDFF